MARITGIQRSPGYYNSIRLMQLEEKLVAEFNCLLREEELLWYQKSRTRWIEFGDRNTKFFHTSTIVRRKRNHIKTLKLDNGEWSSDQESIQNHVISYFKDLFSAPTDCNNYVSSNCFPALSVEDAESLCRPVTMAETWGAVKSMADLKAPGPDGFHAIFIKKCRGTVRGQIHEMVQNAFSMATVLNNINDTLIVLIPKVDHPQTIKEFRPISLCNVVYKIISKVMVNRLKPLLSNIVSPNQSSFVPNRQTADNIFVVQEIIHKLRNRKAKRRRYDYEGRP